MYSHNVNIPLCKQVNQIQLNLVYFDNSITGTEWKGRIVSPDCSRLYYVTRGTSYITMNGVRTQLIPGKWYLLPAGCSFDFECIEEMEQLYFHFKFCDFDDIDLLSNYTEPIFF